MKKIQLKYLLWALVATFSLNVAMPIFAAEPKQEKLSFLQRIKLLRRAKEWLKETNELRKKVKAGTATKEEKKRYIRRVAGIGTIIALLILIPGGVWFRKLMRESEEIDRELNKLQANIKGMVKEQKETLVRWAAEDEAMAADQKEWDREQELMDEFNRLLTAYGVVNGRYSLDQALEKIKRELGSAGKKKEELVGTLQERAESILDGAIKRVRKLDFDLLEASQSMSAEEVMAKVRSQEGVLRPAKGVRGVLLEE